jgi:hypothetical protein
MMIGFSWQKCYLNKPTDSKQTPALLQDYEPNILNSHSVMDQTQHTPLLVTPYVHNVHRYFCHPATGIDCGTKH